MSNSVVDKILNNLTGEIKNSINANKKTPNNKATGAIKEKKDYLNKEAAIGLKTSLKPANNSISLKKQYLEKQPLTVNNNNNINQKAILLSKTESNTIDFLKTKETQNPLQTKQNPILQSDSNNNLTLKPNLKQDSNININNNSGEPTHFDTNQIKIKKEVNPLQAINRNTLVRILSNQEKTFSKQFNIKVIGVGGAGNNIIKYMVNSYEWPQFVNIIALNTDFVALSNLGSNLQNIFILGADDLQGNGSGGDPTVGRQAAEADIATIKSMLENTDVLILVAGLGKGTGTGATPIIAKAAQELDILTIGLFNLPSIGAEGEKTYQNALEGLQSLMNVCNGLTTVNNDKIINTDKEKMSIKKAYEGANKYIKTIVEEIIEIITKASDINVDFADVKNFFRDKNGFLFLRLDISDYTKDSLKEMIEEKIRTGFSDVDIKHSEKALINFKLNENVPSIILENTRSALKDIVGSGNVNIVHGIGYNDLYQDAEINILLTGGFDITKIDDLQKDEASSLVDISNTQNYDPYKNKSDNNNIYDTLKRIDENNKMNDPYVNTYPNYNDNQQVYNQNQNVQANNNNAYPSTVKLLNINNNYEKENTGSNNQNYYNDYNDNYSYPNPQQNQYYQNPSYQQPYQPPKKRRFRFFSWLFRNKNN